ncbi:MAG: hypothetical protein ACOYL5_00155 [Phototrophicaceae bacterium]
MQHVPIPVPDLRIIAATAPLPHEEHDSQRAEPLIETLQRAEYITNPPIVAHTEDDLYIILDGANRCYSITQLGIPHLLVQVASYINGQVELATWNHVISGWSSDAFIRQLRQLAMLEIHQGEAKHDQPALAHIITADQQRYAIYAPAPTIQAQNAVLRAVVQVYQRQARLNRTPFSDPVEVWDSYPTANALVIFPGYHPQDIVEAARQQAFLPPGISRHIVHGRALQLNYPMAVLKDTTMSLTAKNDHLQAWLQEKFLNRQVRYYAESTYQFNE